MFDAKLMGRLAPTANARYRECVNAKNEPAVRAVLDHYCIWAPGEPIEPLAGFLANVVHETGSFTVIRESLRYRTAPRLRAVWPTRFGNKSDAELRKYLTYDGQGQVALLSGGVAGAGEYNLAQATYAGRMGNRPNTDDAFVYRGAWWMQTTGRAHTMELAKECGYTITDRTVDEVLDNPMRMLCLAALEWYQANCSELCVAGNFDGACAAINVGNAAKVKAVVGLPERRRLYAKIKSLLAGKESEMLVAEASSDETNDVHWTEMPDDSDVG